MKPSNRHAFTLVELLVVLTIIGVLTGIILPVYGSVQLAGKRTQSLTNMRQLGAACLSYCGDNNGMLPLQGDATSWGMAAANNPTENNAWYNALPRTYANSKGLGDFAANPADFYTKSSMFYVPAAKYPDATKLSAPLFAVAFNSKIQTSSVSSARLQTFGLPAETVVFQESGIAGETPIKGQKAYTNQAYSYASRTAARYNGQTILTFADGHASLILGTSIIDPSTGKAYFPPLDGTKVYWSMDPTVTPN